MNKYQFKTKTPSGLGNVYYYCYADDRFETYLNIKNIKYKKNWKNQGKNEFEQLQQELQRKDKTIQIMENYLELIYDLGYDHDGCETTGDLICLMDELVRYASLGRACNTTEVIYENGNNKYNILHEEIKK